MVPLVDLGPSLAPLAAWLDAEAAHARLLAIQSAT
jgi:hypothetical protein